MPTSKICPAVPSGVFAVRRRLNSTLCLVFSLLWLSAGWRAALAAPCTVTISPGASINSTLSAAGPGSVVCLSDGNYGQSVKFPLSGTANAWITLTAVNALGATVKSVDINNQNYIEVDYLHVTGGSDLGISTQGGHHTRVIGNLVENMPGGGINLNSGDYRV